MVVFSCASCEELAMVEALHDEFDYLCESCRFRLTRIRSVFVKKASINMGVLTGERNPDKLVKIVDEALIENVRYIRMKRQNEQVVDTT